VVAHHDFLSNSHWTTTNAIPPAAFTLGDELVLLGRPVIICMPRRLRDLLDEKS
jgi:hypothetical protein